MTQWWRNLLFAHWPVPAADVQRLLPASLEVDCFDESAWVAVVPFEMTGVRPRLTPALPWFSNFAELNVRTYVRPRGQANSKPGVYFWSLEASNPFAVAVARRFFHLPYMNASMQCQQRGEWVNYQSQRTHRAQPPAVFEGRYRPLGPAPKTELTRFLTERYCLYTTDSYDRLYRGEIHHPPWSLEHAELELHHNTMAEACSIHLPAGNPLLHFARAIQVAIWPLKRLS